MVERNGDTSRNMKKVMVFCDGTWCGQLTGTKTNVKILADAIAGYEVKVGEPLPSTIDSNITVCYFDGEGVQGNFSDYILDGALGGNIKHDCLKAYRVIMDEFENTSGNCEAWLIGLSRGSYTVRSVAGLINNCGIISRSVLQSHLARDEPLTNEEMEDLINRAYDYYRDRTLTYMPDTDYMKEWRKNHSRETERPPIKFMGLFETVGSLGIPSLNPGQGVEYYGTLNFYGKQEEGASGVSGEVERVYQALAVHDRMTAFSPCHVKRDKPNDQFYYNEIKKLGIKYETEERWFPGAHYDLGRQKFMFFKSPSLCAPELKELSFRKWVMEIATRAVQKSISFWLTRLLRIPDIHPETTYSETVLLWMMEKMIDTDSDIFGYLRTTVRSEEVETVPWSLKLYDWLTLKPAPLYNDAYDQLVEKRYLSVFLFPLAHQFLVTIFTRYLLKDRTILDPPLPSAPSSTPPAPPVQFEKSHGFDADLRASARYRSRSYDAYLLEQNIR
ncbi:uncharacterized protein [Physcomitrium patens]|uniref:T6SS Phospholipase effector Tle1-like catalytic domain-containing protein n=1 Tax=Physcomitrium patens TaxID=3218 RepID=A9TGB7_PHYPA|nr:uncharacterized protein LOC112292812 [Physcomitrium patens]XP_024397415.1 uncharacterized protein LOC112292812 [Physcomitrium patens]PNR39700.1 hypothetical protein PHYPA_019979 [Physcomitrium patens]|eukprot:XP_024397414.1 uncharacterized protein LOC112292812 [Physcomitrella patens]